MANPSNSVVQNLLPVQAYFNLDGSFNTFIGQGVPFYATANPIQSGLTITNSTLNSSPIGNTSPSTGVFTNIATTTGTISTQPVGANDIVNLLALQSYAAGISWKQPVAVATLTNITLSGLQTIDSYTTLAGDRVLVKNQSTQADNGIYLASAGAWTRALDADVWNELIAAISFVEYGTQKGGAWFCTAQPGGTLGTTPVIFSQFTTSATYSAGTGLTLTGSQFSITPVGTASTYGSATQTPVFTTNASGQVTAVTNTTITPALGSITGFGTGIATALAVNAGSVGSVVINGGALGTPTSGTLTNCTFPTLNQNTTGYAASLAGGVAGSLPYQSAVNTTTFLGIGSNGQVLTVAAGVPSWATPTTGTVTSVSGTGSVNGITLTGTVTSTGNLVLGGTLGSIANSQLTNSSITFGATAAALGTTVSGFNAVTIGATTPSTGAFTVLSTSSTTSTTPTLSFNASNSTFAMGAIVAGNFLQSMLQNKSGTAGASTNYVVSNDLGTDSTYYGEFGMNSSVFSASTPADFFSINNGIYFSGHDGDMSVGSGNGFKTYLAWGTTGQSAHVINATGAIGLSTNLGTTPATSGTSGFGIAGYLMQTNGSGSAPTWVAQSTIAAGSATTATTATNAVNTGITDDTTTATTVYPTWVTTTFGNLPQKTSSTKMSFVPSTGTLSATTFSGAHTGSGAGLTGIPNSALTNSSVTVTAGIGMSGGGAVALGSSVTLTNAGVTSAVAGTGITISGATGAVTVTNSLPSQTKAWVTFSGGSGTVNGSYNVSSVTRTGTGNYVVNFTSALSSVNFCPTISVSQGGSNPIALAFDAGPNLNSGGYTGYASTSTFKFITGNQATSVPSDPNICSVIVCR